MNFSIFKKNNKDIEKMRLYFILAFIHVCKTFMVWPGAFNQLDYNTVPDIQKYYLDGSNIHIVLITR